MSVTTQDVCIVYSKTIRSCQDITCTVCKMYVHKKCTKLKPKDFIKCAEWTCEKCKITNENLDDTVEVHSSIVQTKIPVFLEVIFLLI